MPSGGERAFTPSRWICASACALSVGNASVLLNLCDSPLAVREIFLFSAGALSLSFASLLLTCAASVDVSLSFFGLMATLLFSTGLAWLLNGVKTFPLDVLLPVPFSPPPKLLPLLRFVR